jgi:hypothetical protein
MASVQAGPAQAEVPRPPAAAPSPPTSAQGSAAAAAAAAASLAAADAAAFSFAAEEVVGETRKQKTKRDHQKDDDGPGHAHDRHDHQHKEHKEKDKGECRCCDMPKSRSSPYCPVHKRAYDCVSRSGHASPGSDQHLAFTAIFGSGKNIGNPAAAARVLNEFVRRYPEGKFKPGVSRGSVDLTQFVEIEGIRQMYNDDDDGVVKIDYESWGPAMAKLRGWTAKQAHDEWERLSADTEKVKRDNAGIRGSERLYIPSNYFGGLGLDRGFKRKSTYQEKQQVTSSKARRLTHQEREKMRDELNKGFKRCDAEIVRSTFAAMHEALPAGSSTSYSGASGKGKVEETDAVMDVLRAVAQSAGIEVEGANFGLGSTTAGSVPSGASSVASAATAASSPLSDKAAASNVASARNWAFTDTKKGLKKALDRFVKVMDTAARLKSDQDKEPCASAADFAATLAERLSFAEVFLGKRITPGGSSDMDMNLKASSIAENLGDAEKEEWKPPADPSDEKKNSDFKQKVHDRLLKDSAAKLRDPPVEDVDSLWTWTKLENMVNEFRHFRTIDQVEELKRQFDDQHVAVKQLEDSVKTAARDLRRSLKNAAAEARKEEEDDRKKKNDAAMEQKKKQDAEEQKKIKKMKHQAVFQLDLARHSRIAVVKGEDAWAKGKAAMSVVEPWILTGVEAAKSLMPCDIADPGAKDVQKALARWIQAFPTNSVAAQEDKVSAPMYKAHGSDDFDGFIEDQTRRRK